MERIESPEIDPYVHIWLTNIREKKSTLLNGVYKLDNYMQKNEDESLSHTVHRIQLKWIKEFFNASFYTLYFWFIFYFLKSFY